MNISRDMVMMPALQRQRQSRRHVTIKIGIDVFAMLSIVLHVWRALRAHACCKFNNKGLLFSSLKPWPSLLLRTTCMGAFNLTGIKTQSGAIHRKLQHRHCATWQVHSLGAILITLLVDDIQLRARGQSNRANAGLRMFVHTKL